MNQLDKKITMHFPGLVVRKDLVKAVRGNTIVPAYVLEYLLGQYCATDDEATIQSGIDTVKQILSKHYVHRNEAGLVRSNIREKGRHKVIDKVSVSLNEKADVYEADFANLGIKKILVDAGTIKAHPKLLVGGVWCIADIEYRHAEGGSDIPWVLSTLKPIQMSNCDFEGYIQAREQFSTDEWIDLLFQTIGFNPSIFGKRSKLTQLIRLIPFCERNYNLVELGPKGTGKSHIYSEFSPHGILLSGGEVTVPKLFVNNSTGKIGLVGYWDCVAFDEFAGKNKRVDKALVDILKNYMANKSFSRGVEMLSADASIAFVGNNQHTVPFLLKQLDLFHELPGKFYDSAFLDRIHYYIPGWEVDIIRGEMFGSGYGFVVDYLAEILRSLRHQDYSDRYAGQFTLSPDLSTRDRDGINKTFSGLAKLLFPDGGAHSDEIEMMLKLSMEGRKRVKDQLLRIDHTYPQVSFSYIDSSSKTHLVSTLEELEYPDYYHKSSSYDEQFESSQEEQNRELAPMLQAPPVIQEMPRESHMVFQENQRGVSFDILFGPYLQGATQVTITDPYIRQFHQARNVMELLETILRYKPSGESVSVHLLTKKDEEGGKQEDYFEQIKNSASSVDLKFSWSFDATQSLHARHIVTDHGWKISLDRGLDIFQRYEMNDAFSFANRIQRQRSIKAFEVTYLFEQGEKSIMSKGQEMLQ